MEKTNIKPAYWVIRIPKKYEIRLQIQYLNSPIKLNLTQHVWLKSEQQ